MLSKTNEMLAGLLRLSIGWGCGSWGTTAVNFKQGQLSFPPRDNSVVWPKLHGLNSKERGLYQPKHNFRPSLKNNDSRIYTDWR